MNYSTAANHGLTAAATVPGLTQDQLQKLLSLIESPKPGFDKISGNKHWMFDSGASCHMTGDLNLIQEIKKIDSVAIGLPNGTHTLAGQEGSVVLGERIKLNKVLYVPSFKCNLVSIAKLCKELNCSVTFYDDFCVLQDRTSRTPIGVGKQNRGVYFFTDGSVEERKVNAVSTVDLWHRRLGHPSCETLSHLSSSLQVNFDKNKVDIL